MNDWLLKINDVDLTNKDRKQVMKAVLNGGGVINMVVRRRKSLGGRIITPIHLNLAGHKGKCCLCAPLCAELKLGLTGRQQQENVTLLFGCLTSCFRVLNQTSLTGYLDIRRGEIYYWKKMPRKDLNHVCY